jgi:GT2 family glycosyltransferase
MLEYAIVVATRNRYDMLTVSFPRFVEQSRPAARIVVVDRSDDHDAVRRLCESFRSRSDVPIDVIHGSEANLPAQRNQGLERIEEPVVVFPDDDSLWFPDTVENLLRVYEDDVNGRYGAVSITPVDRAPDDLSAAAPAAQRRFGALPLVTTARNLVESRVVPSPFNVFGNQQTRLLRDSAESDGLAYPLVPSIGGYRMSFRTEVVKKLAFDDVLGSRIGYATHEDMDMGLRVLAAGFLIAAAPESRVFHNTYPGKRAGGFQYGFFHVFNYLYICRKVFPSSSSRLVRLTRRYLAYKVALYRLRQLVRPGEYHDDVQRGARAAFSEFSVVAAADNNELARLYAEVSKRHLG